MDAIKIFDRPTPEHAKLSAAASRIAEASGLDCEVENVYYDFGQGWRWTTIIGYPDEDRQGVQILSPRQQEQLLHGTEDGFHDAITEAVATMIQLHRSGLAARNAVAARNASKGE